MHDKYGYVVVIVMCATACVCATGAGMKCYNCTSNQLPGLCGADFRLTVNSTDHVVSGCDRCSRIIRHVENKKEYIRRCIHPRDNGLSFASGCKSETRGSVKVEECFCNHALCNRAPGPHPRAVSMVVVMLVGGGLALLRWMMYDSY